MQNFKFLRPNYSAELVEILTERNANILAGGTDIIPKMRRSQYSSSFLVDITQIEELRFIRMEKNCIVIGATTTHQEIANSELLADINPSLVAAALTVGSEQTRNRGTIGGNIANASPAADSIPPLLIFDADVHLIGKQGERTVPLEDFIICPGITRIAEGEFIHSVSFQPYQGTWGTAFLKQGIRNGMSISVVNAAAGILLDTDGKIIGSRLCLGSVAPKVIRCYGAEGELIGQRPEPEVLDRASQMCLKEIAPINDVRSSAEYRNHSARVVARRVLEDSAKQALRLLG